MQKILIFLFGCLSLYSAAAAPAGPPSKLVHTKLELRPDYAKCYLYGREWLSLRAGALPIDSVTLDAKGMDIRQVAVFRNGRTAPLQFAYDSLKLRIRLDRAYAPAEAYTLYIAYTAKPNERKGIRKNEKGLYFINPQGKEKDKPTQVWTEGEPESSSAWFPTIDRPDQKSTSEISLTVPAKYVTLSNGRLAAQERHPDGTRTDTWKMEKPHAPYLFMLAVGDFKIYHDHWGNKPVDYYLEPQYAPYAKDIFGRTPEAMAFFSKTLGLDFPWNKYAEIVVRDYVSGAMENTTASVFGEPVQGTRRELADRYYDAGPEHELFHQWFGDYVTMKDWGSLTLSESFADLGELIWLEHRYGKDAEGEHWYKGLQTYLGNPANYAKPLVNAHYGSASDLFNNVTYQKGGRILYMLKDYLGDAAFYKGLHLYLTGHALANADVSDLRRAMEKASGKDLGWFFKQWYFGAGHPVLDISYTWDQAAKTEKVIVLQTQAGPAFRLPVAVDLYVNGARERRRVWLTRAADTLIFPASARPDLVNVDADKVLVAQKTDHKDLAAFVFQYFHAPLYLDRYEALDFALDHQSEPAARGLVLAALKDPFPGLRAKAIAGLNLDDPELKRTAEPLLDTLVRREPNNLTRAVALDLLAKYHDPASLPLFRQALNSPSYTVQAAALNGIAGLDPKQALDAAATLEADNEGPLTTTLFNLYAANGSSQNWPFVYGRFTGAKVSEKIKLLPKFTAMICRLDDPAAAQQGIAVLLQMGLQYKAQGAAPYILKCLKQVKTAKTGQNDQASLQAADNAAKTIGNSK